MATGAAAGEKAARRRLLLPDRTYPGSQKARQQDLHWLQLIHPNDKKQLLSKHFNSKEQKKPTVLTSSSSKGPVHREGRERHRPEGELRVRVSAGRGRQDPGVLGTF